MKKIYPYIFPAVALLFVLFLLFRWYNLRTQREGDMSLLSENVKIENLDASEANSFLKGTGDFQTTELAGEPEYSGQVRYEVVDGKVLFSVMTTLPELNEGTYQVWLKETEGASKRKAFNLEYAKGGYMGSAAIDADLLPLEVIVSQEMENDDTLEKVLLRGVITTEE